MSQSHLALSTSDTLSKLQEVKRTGAGWTARCPAHNDNRNSLSIKDDAGRAILHCHANCDWKDVRNALVGNRPTSRTTSVAYVYQDEQGNTAFEVCRKEPKGFVQRRPDGNGGYIYDLHGTPKVPYRLPELLEADPSAAVFVVEGEKDVDKLWSLGLVATTNSGGAGKWYPAHSEFLRGRVVAILPDNDEPGQAHARQVANSLHSRAESVKVVTLPGLPEKGDVSDWLEQGGTTQQLFQHVEAAAVYEPPAQSPDDVGQLEVDETLNSLAAHEAAAGDTLPCTDKGNAMRLVRQHGRDLRWCDDWRRWQIWDGSRWEPDNTGEAMRRAKDTVERIAIEAETQPDRTTADDLRKHSLRSQSHKALRDMLSLAQSDRPIPVTPQQFDTHSFLLSVKNGTINLRTGELRDSERTDLITKLAPVIYDKDAKCTTWETFLDRIMGGSTAMIEFLQRAIGYSLTGSTAERCFFIMYGVGRNGKSTFLQTVRNLMGDYAKRAPAQMLLAQKDGAIPADVAAMKGARFVTVSETDEGKRLGEALIKDITGNETMAARFLHANWFEFRPECKIWLGTNHRPDIRGGDQAIWDRVKLLPFAVRIPEREQDRELGDKLNEELPGILAWAVRGCLEWQGKGIGFPPEVINATKEYQVDVDALGAFIEDCCIVGPTLRGKPAQLYDAYDAWCRMNNEHAVSKKMFGMKLKDRGFTAGKTDSDRWWGGVGLKYPTRDA